MTKDNDKKIDADDERGYFQTETELVGAFLYEVIKPKFSEDMWDTLIKAIHNERVGSPTGIQTLGRVLADFLVVGAIEMDDRHILNLAQIVPNCPAFEKGRDNDDKD